VLTATLREIQVCAVRPCRFVNFFQKFKETSVICKVFYFQLLHNKFIFTLLHVSADYFSHHQGGKYLCTLTP
jgi:hypothetical protein